MTFILQTNGIAASCRSNCSSNGQGDNTKKHFIDNRPNKRRDTATWIHPLERYFFFYCYNYYLTLSSLSFWYGILPFLNLDLSTDANRGFCGKFLLHRCIWRDFIKPSFWFSSFCMCFVSKGKLFFLTFFSRFWFQPKSGNRIANSVDPDETAHNEPFHLEQHCLHKFLFCSAGLKGLYISLKYILAKSSKWPLTICRLPLKPKQILQFYLNPQIGRCASQFRHQTVWQNSEYYIQDAPMNTGTPIFKIHKIQYFVTISKRSLPKISSFHK